MESKSGNEFIKTKSIENVLCYDNITDNRRLRKSRNKTYADVVLGGLDLSTEEAAFDTRNNDEVNFVKRDDRKEGIDLNAILVDLNEEKMSPQHPTSPPNFCSDISNLNNSSDCFNKQVILDEDVNGKISQILDDLLNLSEGSENRSQVIKEQVNESFQNSHITSENRLTGYFCSETIFNLSHRMLTDAEIKAVEKGLDFAPTQQKISEPELKQDFNGFCRRSRLKWYFRDKTQEFSETPAFAIKSTWNPPKGHPVISNCCTPTE